jgi:DNA mismatch repair ATPase MutS
VYVSVSVQIECSWRCLTTRAMSLISYSCPLFNSTPLTSTRMLPQDRAISYSYTLRRGLNVDSYGIAVARLCGVPIHAITVATKLKRKLEDSIRGREGGDRVARAEYDSRTCANERVRTT